MTDEEKLNTLLKEKDKLDNKIYKLRSKIRTQMIKNCLHQYETEFVVIMEILKCVLNVVI